MGAIDKYCRGAHMTCPIHCDSGKIADSQKASQTLGNFYSTTYGIKYPTLLYLDKEEIITKAKEKGIWQNKHVGGCVIVPLQLQSI